MRTLASLLVTLAITPTALADTWTESEPPRETIELDATRAKPSAGRFGLGMETTLTGIFAGSASDAVNGGSLLLSYDAQAWRLEGLFGLINAGELVGVRGGRRLLIAVHRGDHADFSVGAGGFVLHAAVNSAVTRGQFDMMAQVRAFLGDDVALMGSVGVSIGVGPGDPVVLVGGQLGASLGLAYYF